MACATKKNDLNTRKCIPFRNLNWIECWYQYFDRSSEIAVPVQWQWEYGQKLHKTLQNCSGCCEMASISTILHEIVVAENRNDSRFQTESGHAAISVHAQWQSDWSTTKCISIDKTSSGSNFLYTCNEKHRQHHSRCCQNHPPPNFNPVLKFLEL